MRIEPGKRCGTVIAPRSKSHEHRLLIADFLAGDYSRLAAAPQDAADIVATKRCLRALRTENPTPMLDCGESGSTRRFLSPIAAALGKRPIFKTAGRLASRPQLDYSEIRPGSFELAGDVSSQFVTGLLFALPCLTDDSQLRFTSPLQSSGYVEMTCRVLAGAGIRLTETENGFEIPGNQRYRPQPHTSVEGDWSGAAFWYAMNALGSAIDVKGLSADSAQPDRVVVELVRQLVAARSGEALRMDVSGCPDLFPALSVVAGATLGETCFIGTRRLRLKESDRAAAMAEVLKRFGVRIELGENHFTVWGRGVPLDGGKFPTFDDHRIAMSIAVGATVARSAVELDRPDCVAKSYPGFFDVLSGLSRREQ